MIRSAILVSTLFVGAACYNQKANSTAPESDVLAAQQRASLPVTGTWRATHLYGFTRNDEGKTVPLRAAKSELNKESWRLQFNIDSEGDGYLSGKMFCRLKATKISALGDNLSGSRFLLTANGIVGGIHLLATAIEMGRCTASESGFTETLVPVNRALNFLGQPDPRLDKNLGFAGEGISTTAAEKECRTLRGVRFITINNSAGCVGFRDALANKIRFIVVPAGEVHAVRVDFERD
ncbi:MAG: hypothetical protein FJY29_09920 [Betaproteobacteria bacterium]|nr:hypothetical protein [Betaproteobacteria bacterium]